MSTLLKMQKFHPLCSRCIGMYPLQNRWTVLRYLQCYENFSECCTHLILPETALFSPTPTFAKEPKCILAVKNDTTDYYAANSCSHSKVRSQITQDDYNKIYEHLLDLISCLFIQFFSKHTFGTNQKIVSCFSLLPPIIRYKVLSFLYANDNHNIILIDKLVLVTLKEFGKEKTTQWLEDI